MDTLPTLRRLTLALVALAFSVSCAGAPEDAPSESRAPLDAEAEIAWFPGTVEEAFEAAATEDRPLFLYWGAEWCPPCHYLKSRLFHDPAFVEASRRFVPVYLDGDTERAQTVGEELGASGYPTVLLFSPRGEEILRLPNDLPVDRYVEILGEAIRHAEPVDAMLTAVLEAPEEAQPARLRLLALYSWGQSELDLSDDEQRAAFATLWRATPDTMAMEQARFLALYLGSLDPEHPPAKDERAELLAATRTVLRSPVLRRGNVSFVCYDSKATLELLTEGDAETAALAEEWLAAARAMEDDPELSVDDRLTALLPALWLEEKPAGGGTTPSAELLERVRSRIAWAVETVEDEGEMQTVMSTMAYLLETAGLASEAESLLTDNLDRTVAPYYFMSWLGSLALDDGREEEGLAWYRRAYDESQGRYSRFRWGSIYLRRLLDVRPEATATIDADSREILGELLTLDDAFAGGNWSRLGQLEEAYLEWDGGGDGEAVLGGLRELVAGECGRYPEAGDDSPGARCRSFLAGV